MNTTVVFQRGPGMTRSSRYTDRKFGHPEQGKSTILCWNLESYDLTRSQKLILARRIASVKQFLNREDRLSELFFSSRRRLSNVLQYKWKCYLAYKILKQKRKHRNLALKYNSLTNHMIYNNSATYRTFLNENIRRNILQFC